MIIILIDLNKTIYMNNISCSQNYNNFSNNSVSPLRLSKKCGNYFLQAYQYGWDCYKQRKSNKAQEAYKRALNFYYDEFKLNNKNPSLEEKLKYESILHPQTLQSDKPFDWIDSYYNELKFEQELKDESSIPHVQTLQPDEPLRLAWI